MKRSDRILEVGLVLVFSLMAPAGLAGDAPSHAYVGAEKCKMCHNVQAKGAPFAKWVESRHSKAFVTLGSDEAKKAAAAKGIADPQKAPECLKCHVTGYGAPAEKLTDKWKMDEGVGCEACHGPAGDYWKMDVMKDHARSLAAGMVVPTEETCKKCHNSQAPTFKGFDFKVSLAKIAHPNPQKTAQK